MNTKRIIHVVFVVSMILVLGFAVSPASAKAPIIDEGPYAWAGDVYECDGFTITGIAYGTQRTMLWLDENDELERGHNQLTVTEIWSANGKDLEFTNTYPINGWVETFPDGYIFYIGVYKVTVPHEGVVYAANGLYSYTFTIVGGEIMILDPLKLVGHEVADWDWICGYFAE
jgi:hypothetical protein